MKKSIAILLIGMALALAGCASLPKTSSQAVVDLSAGYVALGSAERAYGLYCASTPTVAPCPTTPFAKIQAGDTDLYTLVKTAQAAAQAGDNVAVTTALATAKVMLPSIVAMFPAGSSPTLTASLAALQAAVGIFTTDMGAVS